MRNKIKRRAALILERHPIYSDDYSAPTYRITAVMAELVGEDLYRIGKKTLKRYGNELHGPKSRYVILHEVTCTH